jgi:hypothetical protein
MTEVVYLPAGAKTRLYPNLCKPLGHTVETDLPLVLDAQGIERIETAIPHYYVTTGVQPYFLLLSGLDGDPDPDYDTVNDYLYNKYVDLFGEDEGHLILLMFYDEGDYVTWYITGYDADTVISTADCETLLDNVDYYAQYLTDVPEVITTAFTTSADAWKSAGTENGTEPVNEDNTYPANFYETQERMQMAIGGGVFVVILVTFIVIVFMIIRRAKKSVSDYRTNYGTNSGNPGNVGRGQNPYGSSGNPYGSSGDFGSPAAPAQQPKPAPRANYPVRCPYCGATAYPKDNGTCEYCGSKIPDNLINGK